MLDLAEFSALVGDRLRIDLSHATSDSLLREDLAFDSLAMVEVLILFSTYDVVLPEDLLSELRTFGDLHHYFNALSPAPLRAVASGANSSATRYSTEAVAR
jgi:acyl carrier protein